MRIPHDPQYAWSVQEVNQGVRTLLSDGFDQPIWVMGELGRINAYGRETIYSTLKDPDGSSIGIVHFNGAAQFRKLGLATGSSVMVLAQVDCFVHKGTYQLRVLNIMPANQQGGLMQRYLETRDRLAAEGLFDKSRKRLLPALPSCIGVLTSVNGAAVHDFIETALGRVPNLHIRVIGVKVQGAGAAQDVLRGLQYLNAEGVCDVIVITRGGGSMEDLWEFNDETLARGIAASNVPVVSAVGHQIDHTICDFVADCSVITPTDAAVQVTEQAFNATQRLQQLQRRMVNSVRLSLSQRRYHLTRLQACPYLTKPENLYTQQTMRLDHALASLNTALPFHLQTLRGRLEHNMTRLFPLPQRFAALQRRRLEETIHRLGPAIDKSLSQRKAELQKQSALLDAYNPRGVLGRGYSILLDTDGNAVRKPSQVEVGQQLRALLADGEMQVQVR